MRDFLFPWMSKPPRLIFILFAIVLIAGGQYLRSIELVGPLGEFTAYLDRSLRSFDALNLAKIFYRELSGCSLDGLSVTCAAGPDPVDVLAGRDEHRGLISSVLAAIINTTVALVEGSTWLGRIFTLVLLIVAGRLIAALTDLHEGGPIGVLLLVVLTPALASLLMLTFKWLLLLFVLVFSQVLGGIVWVIATFGAVFIYLTMANNVMNTAHGLQAAVEAPPKNPKA